MGVCQEIVNCFLLMMFKIFIESFFNENEHLRQKHKNNSQE